MNRVSALLIGALTALVATRSVQAQQPGPTASQSAESVPEVNYHLTVMMPQYRFLDTSGYGGRVGEYDSLQQSLGGDLSFDYVNVPEHMTVKSTWDIISRDDYDLKSRVTFGKWLDFSLDNRGFIRHLDDNSYFGASVISPDIIRIDTISPDSLLGVRRRMNDFTAKVQLPNVPVKLFVKGGWQTRDGSSQMQYFDMGGNGTLTDTGCDNCHSASQYRTLNYTTRNIAGGAEVKLGKVLKVVYQHEFRSFNDRMPNPRDIYGTSDPNDDNPPANIPLTPAGYYVHSVLPRHQTQADSLQVSMAVAHHVTLNGDISYARTNNLFVQSDPRVMDTGGHSQNSLNADATLAWNPISQLRVVADFHQQNLVNDFVSQYSLADPAVFYVFGNPSLHRHWAGLKLAYRVSKQFDVETYYKRTNITRSNSGLWPQFSSPDNTDPLYIVPESFSNTAGAALHFHSAELWNARAGYEWTGMHDPGYVTDPHTNHRVFGDVTITPVRWFTIGNDASIILQQSFPVVQRSNHIYTDTTFLTIMPVPQWSIGASYTYLQDNLRTDMQFANDPAVGVYTQPLVPFKQLSQTFSIHSGYELKKHLGLNVSLARSQAHSGWRPDLNPADYPNFPGAVTVAGYPSEAAFAAAFASALGIGAGPVSQANVPQTLVGATGNYHLRAGYDGGLHFNYGSYTDNTIWNTPGVRPNVNGKLQSYSVFFGRVW
ncbi:MAG: hypothetical protein WCC04_18135 [Terriglobales bacterium]